MNFDGEMQFGDLEEAGPRTQLRPDRNRHYAVMPYGTPSDDELPVFIDLDVLREMEQHAAADTRVELGGVVLGAQCVDNEGQPFVVVTDSLRAEHYQATKGSFKFTHETWEDITRRRDEFPPDTEMVGWYHTHPDWGVFLSGMDLFICENFFARPLDIAIVIDPCRGDRGVFVWNGEGEIRQAAGFYVMTSRFRENELAWSVRQLEEDIRMRSFGAPSVPAAGQAPQVIQITQPSSPWLLAAAAGILAVQLLTLLIFAWALTRPAPNQPGSAELARLVEVLEQQTESAARETATTAKLQVLDELLALQAGGTLPNSAATQLAQQREEIAQLRGALAGLDAAQRDAQQQLAERDALLAEIRENSKIRQDRLQRKLDETTAELHRLQERNRELAEAAGVPVDGGQVDLLAMLPWWGWLLIVAAVMGGGAAMTMAALRRRNEELV